LHFKNNKPLYEEDPGSFYPSLPDPILWL